jgi:four helix bundle protein
MEKVRSFRDLIVWQKAHKLILEIIKDVELFPNTQAAKIVIDQLLRSCGSISANIADMK